MVNARQIVATEKLILALDKSGLELDQVLLKKLKPVFAKGRPSDSRPVYDMIFAEVLARSGKLGAPMRLAVSTALNTPEIDFAEPDLDELGKNVSHVTSQVIAAGKAYAIAGAGSAMKDYVMGQVRSSVASNAAPGSRLIRIANGDACVWCAERDGVPAPGGDLSHHNGCACFVGVA